MADEPIRIAMWSGPRNISTAMMRSFENRPDASVLDEPFYAAFLAGSGEQHPMYEEVLASQPNDWRDVVASLVGPVPGGRPVFYQKHMTHHMLPEFGLDWTAGFANAFLIRKPERVLASYVQKRHRATLRDIGVERQAELFEREADRLGKAPPVIEGVDVLADPRRTLGRLCEAVGIPFSDAMLAWPAGRRDSDGVWAPAWYDAVERSTGFAGSPDGEPPVLDDDLQRVADAARPYYERLAAFALR